MSQANVVEIEARSYELDPYGHLNNAVYVNWFEHGRSAFLRDRGMSWASLPDQFGVKVVIVRAAIDFRAEVKLHDRLRLTTSIARFGTASFTFAQRLAFPDGRVAAEAENVMVVTRDGASAPLPPDLRSRLESGAGGPS